MTPRGKFICTECGAASCSTASPLPLRCRVCTGAVAAANEKYGAKGGPSSWVYTLGQLAIFEKKPETYGPLSPEDTRRLREAGF